MNDKIKAISYVMCGIDTPCARCGIKPHCEITHEKATTIYTAHIKPLEDALDRLMHENTALDCDIVAAKERERMLVEALEDCLSIVEENNKFCMDCADDSIKQARTALASVK